MSTLEYLIDCKAQRMPYWDRAKVAKERGLVLKVYVPRESTLLNIAPGSAIVGVAYDGQPEGRSLIYYEGGIHDTTPRPYEEMVYHAADRMAVDYPTVAKAVVDTADLVKVGYFDYTTTKLMVTDQAALDAWRA
jgi:hypothetical protein